MADLTQIQETGPYQAEWVPTLPEDDPPGCEIPTDPWPHISPTPLAPPTIPTDCAYKFPILQIEPYFQTEVPEIPPFPISLGEAPFEFQIYNATGNKVQVIGGMLSLGGSCEVYVPTSAELTVSVGDTLMFWLQLMRPDGEEADGFDNSCCHVETRYALWQTPIENGPVSAGDWPTWPNQVNAPFISRKLIGYSTAS